MNMGPQAMGGGQGMSSGGPGMVPGPGGPRIMGSGSLGRGAMNNSLMPGGGGMGVRAYFNGQLSIFRTCFMHSDSDSLYSGV